MYYTLKARICINSVCICMGSTLLIRVMHWNPLFPRYFMRYQWYKPEEFRWCFGRMLLLNYHFFSTVYLHVRIRLSLPNTLHSRSSNRQPLPRHSGGVFRMWPSCIRGDISIFIDAYVTVDVGRRVDLCVAICPTKRLV